MHISRAGSIRSRTSSRKGTNKKKSRNLEIELNNLNEQFKNINE